MTARLRSARSIAGTMAASAAESLEEGLARMEMFRRGTFKTWFKHFAWNDQLHNSIVWHEVKMEHQSELWECGLLVVEAATRPPTATGWRCCSTCRRRR